MKELGSGYCIPIPRSRSQPEKRPKAKCSGGFTLLEMVVVVAVLSLLTTLVIAGVSAIRDDAAITVARSTMNAIRDAITGSPDMPGYLNDMKHVPAFQSATIRTHDLLDSSSYPAFATFDSSAKRGWRGPYLHSDQCVLNTNSARSGLFPSADERRNANDTTFRERGFFYDSSNSYYGQTGDMTIVDPWGNPIIIQVPPTGAFTSSTNDTKRFRYARLVSAGPNGKLETPFDRLGGLQSDGTTFGRGDDLVLFLNRADIYENEEP